MRIPALLLLVLLLSSSFVTAGPIASAATYGICCTACLTLGVFAFGTAVVATRVDGLQDAVAKDLTGLLGDSREPAQWTSALEKLIRNPALRQELGATGAQRAHSMDWTSAASNTLDLYSNLTKENN